MIPLCEQCGDRFDYDATASCQTCRTQASKPLKLCADCAAKHRANGCEVRTWTNREPARKLLAQYLVRIDQSAEFLIRRAAECTHEPGSGHFAAINARDFGLAAYDGRLAVMFPKGVPTLYQDCHVHVCEKRETRAKGIRRGHVVWGERDGSMPPDATPVDGETTERLTQYLTIIPAGTHAAVPTLRLRYAETGGKHTIKGYGRQWDGSIDLPASVAWSFGFSASCRSGRYAEAQLYIAEDSASVEGSLFASQSLASSDPAHCVPDGAWGIKP